MFWGAIYRAKYPPTHFIHTQTKEREMKRNHIAIAGILASVLVTMDTARADTGTVIASQAYVDAKVGTKQNKLNAGSGGNITVDNTSTTVASRAITGITATGDGTVTFTTQPISVDAPAATEYITDGANALSLSDSTDHAPSVTAVKGMKTTSVRTSGAVDTLVPTEKAVATALSGKVSSDEINGDNAIITSNNKIPSNTAVQKGVLYIKGDGINNHSATADLSTITAEQSWTTANGSSNSIKTIRDGKKMDDYVPTMAAVEARVKAAERLIPTNLGTLATLNAVGSAQITDGSIAAGDLASDSVTTDKLAAGAVTNAKLGADAVTNAKLADDAVQTENIKDGTIVNADISPSAAIAYSKMDATLKDVNSTSDNASCSPASPCVLTYYKVGSTVYYKWTNLIETDGVTALPASAS